MGNMSLKVLILAGIPELAFLTIITLLLLGKKEVVDFRKKESMLKLATVVLGGILFTYLIKSTFAKYVDSFVLNLIFLIPVLALLYKVKLRYLFLALTLFFISFSIIEFLNYFIVNQATNTTIEQCNKNDNLKLLVFLPMRVLELIISILLYKSRITIINIEGINKITKYISKRITINIICLGSAFITVLLNIKIFVYDIEGRTAQELILIWFNCIILILVAAILIISNYKSMKAIQTEKDNNVIQLAWFQSLLKDNDINKARSKVKKLLDFKRKDDVM